MIDAVSNAVAAAMGKGGPDASAYLVRRPARRTKVALTGKVNEMLAKFVAADATLERVDASDPGVEIVIANGVDPPRDVAAIVIDPPTAPTGWVRGKVVTGANLTGAVAADDPVMRNVSLDKIRVAEFRPWVTSGAPLQVVAFNIQAGFFISIWFSFSFSDAFLS